MMNIMEKKKKMATKNMKKKKKKKDQKNALVFFLDIFKSLFPFPTISVSNALPAFPWRFAVSRKNR